MGTETTRVRLRIQFLHQYQVKLNNPLMGTETNNYANTGLIHRNQPC